MAVATAHVRLKMGLFRHDESVLYQQFDQPDGVPNLQHAITKTGSIHVMQATGDRRGGRAAAKDTADSSATQQQQSHAPDSAAIGRRVDVQRQRRSAHPARLFAQQQQQRVHREAKEQKATARTRRRRTGRLQTVDSHQIRW